MKFTLREKRFPSATGLCDIRYRMWVPEDPHAALQITHGMAEHIDRYDEFASFLAENGVLVYGNDIASHGKSTAAGVPKGYFGEKNEHNCGLCDVCLSKHHSGMKLGEFQEMENQIREQLETSPLSPATLLNRINGEREKAERVLSYHLSEEIIQSNDGILSL